jgi:hypothetical protein
VRSKISDGTNTSCKTPSPEEARMFNPKSLLTTLYKTASAGKPKILKGKTTGKGILRTIITTSLNSSQRAEQSI